MNPFIAYLYSKNDRRDLICHHVTLIMCARKFLEFVVKKITFMVLRQKCVTGLGSYLRRIKSHGYQLHFILSNIIFEFGKVIYYDSLQNVKLLNVLLYIVCYMK